jgi:hypothetical protein
LPLTARELVWVAALCILGQPHARKHRVHPYTSRRPIYVSESFKRFGKYAADGPNRVEGTVRILKDDLSLTVKGTPLLEGQASDILSSEADLARRDGDEAEYGVGQCRFARARLADEPDRLARGQIEADIVDSVHRSSTLAVADAQLADLKQRPFAHAGSTSARISLTRMQRVARSRWAIRSGIASSRHLAIACGHRGAKRQPSGQPPGDGTLPGIVVK